MSKVNDKRDKRKKHESSDSSYSNSPNDIPRQPSREVNKPDSKRVKATEQIKDQSSIVSFTTSNASVDNASVDKADDSIQVTLQGIMQELKRLSEQQLTMNLKLDDFISKDDLKTIWT